MDKFDLDFLVDSQDANLLYKHLLKAICNNSTKIRDGINRYRIDLVTIHRLTSTILYRTEYRQIHTGRIDKYVMEL
jgi:hypothetical protein